MPVICRKLPAMRIMYFGIVCNVKYNVHGTTSFNNILLLHVRGDLTLGAYGIDDIRKKSNSQTVRRSLNAGEHIYTIIKINKI